MKAEANATFDERFNEWRAGARPKTRLANRHNSAA
jgi:hypothetical protein